MVNLGQGKHTALTSVSPIVTNEERCIPAKSVKFITTLRREDLNPSLVEHMSHI